MIAFPAATAVTFPSASTVATDGLPLVHVTSVLVALSGVTVAVKVVVSPSVNSTAALSNDTPVTETSLTSPLTVTVHVSVLAPSSVVTVIVALPADIPLILPFALTATTFGSLLVHSTFEIVAFDGEIVFVRVFVSPTASSIELLFNDTEVTATVSAESAVP